MKEYARFQVETNRDFIIFWAVLFFTCVVGIIELLPEIGDNPVSNQSLDISRMTILIQNINLSNKYAYLTIIYFGLLFLMSVSIYNCFRIYGDNAEFTRSGELGEGIRQYAKKHSTLIDYLFVYKKGKIKLNKKGKIAKFGLIIGVLAVFTLLYCVKIGQLIDSTLFLGIVILYIIVVRCIVYGLDYIRKIPPF